MFDTGMNFNLGEEIDVLQQTIRQFSATHIAPIAAEIDSTNQFPPEM